MDGSFHPALALPVSVNTACCAHLVDDALLVRGAFGASRRPIPAIDTRPDLPEVRPVLASALIRDLALVEARDRLS